MPRRNTSKSYLVESYWPGVTEEQLADARRRVASAAIDTRSAGADVVFVGSILMPADETVFCLFRGDVDDIREVSRIAELPVERVIESHWLDGEAGQPQSPK